MTVKNKYIDQEDYSAGYQESVKEFKNRPEIVELDKLHHAVFEGTENGRKLMDVYEKRFLIPALVHPNSQNYKDLCIFYEGFKEAFRMIRGSVQSHQQRIDAENNRDA